MNNLPVNLQNTKSHKTNIISILFLVEFTHTHLPSHILFVKVYVGAFVFWWRK